MIDNPARLYLASRSPRRAELLRQIGIGFEPLLAEVDETPLPDENPEHYVERVAVAKARAGWQQLLDRQLYPLPVLGADTSVVLGRRIMGKPASRAEGLAMLQSLSGRSHHVMTAVCLCYRQQCLTALNLTRVTMREISSQELLDYWQSGEPRGKAGGYAIQGRAAVFIERIEGSYSAVVGLPLLETSQLLQQLEKEIQS